MLPSAPMGTVLAIWIKRARLGPMDAVPAAELDEGAGLRGNANRGGKRQVTIIDEAAWRAATADAGADVPPSARRANVMLEGVDLTASRGRVLAIGPCRIRINGETRPCERMDEAQPGLRKALETPWRGGAYGEVVTGGTIRVGDQAEWESEEK